MPFVDSQGQPLELMLYTTPTCAYCHRVLRRAGELGLQLPTRDASDAQAYADLLRIGGKGQVPCLVVNGRPSVMGSSH